MLLPKKPLVLEEEMQGYELKNPEKLQEEEDVQVLQEKVLEEQPQGDLLEGEDARTSSFFILFWYQRLAITIC